MSYRPHNSSLTRYAPMPPRKGRPKRDPRKALRSDWRAMPKGHRARVKKELDIEFSIWVRRRETACVTCGTVYDLQASHYFKREFLDVRWDERNVHTMCGRCNERHNRDTAPYYYFMVAQYGEDGLDELRELRDLRRKIPTVEIEELLAEFREQNRKAA